ncbi:MAG: thiamine phosphate synthase [Gemmatimonadota bacterium]|nr:thiamine phosphate synthase [Gemmatimonadota bacterium]
MADLTLPRLHLVTDSGVLERGGFQDCATRVLEAGGADVAVHLRGPRSSGKSVYDMAMALAPVARRHGATLLANDRVDVALAAGLDGVHLGSRSLPIREARALVGPQSWIGVSVHDGSELARARGDGANFAFVGTIFPTDSHPGRAGLGIGGVERILEHASGVPTLAIGGVEPDVVADLLRAGTWGVAVLRGVWARSDPASAVLEYLTALDEALGPSTEGR